MLFVCDKAFEIQARGLMNTAAIPVAVQTVTAGKFRRYSHLSTLRQLMMPQIVFANLRDVVKVMMGIVQSLWLVARFRPDVVFAKGGYVCLPVGIAARLLRIPIVVHDSDARPGLTNQLLGRWATTIATGSPLENYAYPRSISHYVGVPIAREFHPRRQDEQGRAKQALGFDADKPLLVITGGGLGAASINAATVGAAQGLLQAGVQLYHVTGRQHHSEIEAQAFSHHDYKIVPFVYEGMADVLGAADVVISRASATFIQELAGLKKAAILIPSRALGDQRKNAEVYKAADAAVVLTDDEIQDPAILEHVVKSLLDNSVRREQLAARLHEFARPEAARDVAYLVLEAAKVPIAQKKK